MQEFARESSFYRMLKSPLLEGLNEAQCEAVIHGEGPALVVAGPGSGKTLTIIRRILYLVYVRKVPANRILVITYTKEAALSMQEKYHEQREKYKLYQNLSQGYVSFGTFHSYFYQIIKSINKYSEYQLITPQEKYKLSKMILKNGTEDVTDFAIRRFLEQVSFVKNTGKQKNDEDISDLLEKYQTTMHQYKRMDFDDMLYLCKQEFLSNKELLSKWQDRFEYVLIDEYQDINPIQYELVHLLTCRNQNLFVVGDDDQAIYGFRGSDGECFPKMLRDYPATKPIYLVKNYRCAEKIVNASNQLISGNKNRMDKKIISSVKDEIKGEVCIYGNMHSSMCYEKVLEKLGKKDVNQLDKEAILFRTNAALQSFANRLSGLGIPFVLREKFQSLYEHFIVRDLLDYYLAANGNHERSLFLRIFQKYNLCIGREVLTTEQVDISKLKESLSHGFYENQWALAQLETLERHLLRLKRMRPGLGVQYILHAMNYEKYLLSKAGNYSKIPEEWQEILEWLREETGGYTYFKEWWDHIEKCKKTIENHMKMQKPTQKGLHLMTMHASKGLEFEKVYLLNLNEGIIPKLKKGEVITEELIEEERRLFYVALTRAKSSIELHYVTGTKDNPRLRSRFLEEIHIEYM